MELNPEQRALGDRMIQAWTRFAWTGSPTTDAGAWPEFDTGDSPYVRPFDTRSEKQNAGDRQDRESWNGESDGGADAWSEHHCDVWAELP